MKSLMYVVKKINELRDTKANRRVKSMYKAFLIDTYEPDVTMYCILYCTP